MKDLLRTKMEPSGTLQAKMAKQAAYYQMWLFSSSGGLIKTAEQPSLSIGEWEIIFLGITATSIGDIPGIIEHIQKYLIMEKRYCYLLSILLVKAFKKLTKMEEKSFRKHHKKTGTFKVPFSFLAIATGEVDGFPSFLLVKCLFSGVQ